MDSSSCTNSSIGPASQLLGLLVQTLYAQQCSFVLPWPQDYAETACRQNDTLDGNFDFIIVGAGSAGCAIAHRLSENPKFNVLLIEAGADPPIEAEIPSLFFTMQNTPYDWNYFCEPSTTGSLGMPNGTYWPRGKMLGGCSSVNGMVYARGNKQDYDHWEELGNPTWNWDNVLQYFKKSEDQRVPEIAADRKNHAVGGLLKVDRYSEKTEKEAIKLLRSAYNELGYKDILDANGEQNVGIVDLEGTLDNGTRCSSAKAFLLSATNRTNLKILKNAQVTTLIFDQNKRVTGVNFVLDGKTNLKVSARKEVIISAGAINSPQILMNSGIGPAQHLKDMNITLVKNLSVGLNLQDHMIVPIAVEIHKSTAKIETETELAYSYGDYLLTRQSEFASIDANQFTNYASTVNDPKYPDLQLETFYLEKSSDDIQLVLSSFGYNDEITNSLIASNDIAPLLFIVISLYKPKSRGVIQLQSSNPLDKPKIYANYLSDPDDVRRVVDGIRIAQKVFNTTVMRQAEGVPATVTIAECDSKFIYDSDSYWECYARYMSSTDYHFVGTCKMGPASDSTSVVDATLKVHGIKGLRVADASIMPLLVCGNTNAPAIMIGEKVSDFIKQQYGF